ncbi:MAG: nucleotide sugar dehydrogenase [Elusimicrobia bacterium]|nr:nucleotide sugar dehydrogenase [Elusimicrobiota bacterium]
MATERICVLGLGYIGLPTASILATHGFDVVGVDKRKAVIDHLRQGRTPIEEPGLNTLVEAALKSNHLSLNDEVQEADVFMICVPTPHENARADLSFVREAAQSIARRLKPGNLVILESTVPPSTVEKILIPILAGSGQKIPGDVFVAHCPERVLPGNILTELVTNDRIVGGIDELSRERAKAVYGRFVQGEIHLTDCTTAETVKLIENTFRDVNIAFANEVEAVCRKIGINAWDVIRLANKHPRVNILRPGPGVGGHCIAVDPWFLVEAAPEEAKMTRLAREINDAKPLRVIAEIEQTLKNTGKAKPALLCLGATYKANVDDIRESPALHIIEHFSKRRDLTFMVADAHAKNLNHNIPSVALNEGLSKADVIALLVDHKEFLSLDWPGLRSRKGAENILDFKGVMP